MAKFRIEIHPPIAESSQRRTNFGVIDAIKSAYNEIMKAIPENFDIIYFAGREKFCYYPTDIVSIFGDVIDEIDRFGAAKSHYLSVVGYDVAYALCQSGRVWFYDPADVLGVEDQIEPEGEGIPLHLVIEAFERAANDIWAFINSKVELAM